MNLTERYSEKLNAEIDKTDISLDSILLQLEVTNACNHKCVFCPNADSRRNRKMMDLVLAKKIMKECAEFLGVDKRICFHMNGEPLLYKNLVELVIYSKQLGYEYSFLTTNGSLADEKILAELFDAGLDSIKFSINAGNRETYKKTHGVDDFDKVMDALKFSWEYRKNMGEYHPKDLKYKIFVSCVGTKINNAELVEFNELVKKYCDEVVFYYPCSYAGQAIDMSRELYCDLSHLPIKSFEIKHSAPCPVLWNSINVTCEGYLALCCSEANNRLIIEDVKKIGIQDAWLGRKMNAIRRGHLEGKISNMPCFSCVEERSYDETKIDKDLFELSLT